MKCALGCSESINPAIGQANIRARKNHPTCPGRISILPLCYFHKQEAEKGDWGTVVEVIGWEPFLTESSQPTVDAAALAQLADDGGPNEDPEII